MAEKLHTTRRAVLSGLAAMPVAAVPALALADDAQARYRHHLDGLKQAIIELSPTKVYFCRDVDDRTGILTALMVIPAVPAK